jgi:hypothetical protein
MPTAAAGSGTKDARANTAATTTPRLVRIQIGSAFNWPASTIICFSVLQRLEVFGRFAISEPNERKQRLQQLQVVGSADPVRVSPLMEGKFH